MIHFHLLLSRIVVELRPRILGTMLCLGAVLRMRAWDLALYLRLSRTILALPRLLERVLYSLSHPEEQAYLEFLARG